MTQQTRECPILQKSPSVRQNFIDFSSEKGAKSQIPTLPGVSRIYANKQLTCYAYVALIAKSQSDAVPDRCRVGMFSCQLCRIDLVLEF